MTRFALTRPLRGLALTLPIAAPPRGSPPSPTLRAGEGLGAALRVSGSLSRAEHGRGAG